jgi:bacillithiol system protein YtxJ
MHWLQLTSISQFTSLIDSHQDFAVFKHSTRCSVSSMAKSRLERSWSFSDEALPVYYLDVIQHRDVSNFIADSTGIRHESPQLIVWKEGKVVYSASHIAISVEEFADMA